MPDHPIPRRLRAVLSGGAALVLLAGCEAGEFGFSGRDAEWARGDFSVVSASAGRAVVSARGRQVAVEPPPGFCLAQDSVETSDRSAFVLIGDCVLEDGAGVPGADGGLDLPAGMPGIITVSISGDPGFSRRGASEADLSELEAYLESAEGRALLGRGGDGSQVSVIETRRQGDILYVLVEDREGEAVPVLAPRFWRAFVELNDRLAVVTVSGFREVPMDEGQMLRHLGDQVRQLQVANAAPIDEAPIQVAVATPRPRPAETGSGDEVAGDAEVVEIEVAEGVSVEDVAGDASAEEIAVAADRTVTDGPLVAGDATASADPIADGAAPAAPGWTALALAGDVQGEDAPDATGEGRPAIGEADVEAETLALADAAGVPERATGWPALDGAAGVNVADPPVEAPVQPADEPAVVASTGFGGQGAWPMPPARPGGRGSLPMEIRPRSEAGAALEMPLPAPRLFNPAERITGGAPPVETSPRPRQEPAAAPAMPVPPPRQVISAAPDAGSPPPAAAVPLPPRARR